MGFISNIIKGKKKTDYADPNARRLISGAKEGIEAARAGLKSFRSFDPTQGISQALTRQENTIRSSGEDRLRDARGTINRRNLGNSTVGLALNNSIQKETADKIAETRAKQPLMNMQALQDKYKNLMSAGSSLANLSAGKKLRNTTYRSGGLGKALGAGIGAAFGGPAGAQIGSSIGGSLQG